MEEEDRISQLPEEILHHHILSLLPQNAAVRTCVLSKSWRHLGPTRPKLEFDDRGLCNFWMLEKSNEKFLSVVENTLQRYDDQNIPIQEFKLVMPRSDSGSNTPLNKWIPKVIKNMGLKIFSLSATNFSLPPVVFQPEFLAELILHGCKLDQIINVNLHMLKRLSLHAVYLEDEIFEKIMSSCPSIQRLVLDCCKGALSTIKVNKARNLKHFDFYCVANGEKGKISIEIDDAPSLETIRIVGNRLRVWYHHKNYFFPPLKSLNLRYVRLLTELLNNLSSDNCPCLEELQLYNCYGFTEFELSNCSIKRLIISVLYRPIKAAIDAPNMLSFEYKSCYLPTFSFSPTSRDCKSQIEMWRYQFGVISTWDLKLYEFLKSLSKSQISLEFSYLPDLTNNDTCDGGSCEPVVVEHLRLTELYSSSEIGALLNCLFRICRPRYIGLPLYGNPLKMRELANSIWTTLVKKGDPKIWHHDLEESSIQVSEKNANEWCPVQVCEFSNNEEVRFRLKWREI